MKTLNLLKYFLLIGLLFTMSIFIASCGKDDKKTPDPGTLDKLNSFFDITAGPYVTKKDITFTNKSTLADSYLWDFGDTKTSTEESPKHQYSSDGNYVIKLTAFDSSGKTSESSKPITVVKNADLVVASFTVQSGNLYYQNSIKFTNTSSGATSYSWNFGDGGISSSTSPSYTYKSPGTYTVKLSITDGVNTKEVSKNIVVAVKYVTKKITLRGITSKTHDEKVFGDIDLVITDLSTNKIIENKADFWNNQGNATDTGINGTKTSFDNISKTLTLSLDEYLLSIKKYRVTTYTNVGCWHRDNVFATWGRIFNYNNTSFSFDTDGNSAVSSPDITTTSDPNRIHKFQLYVSVGN